jgi:hypothetical protein
VGPPLLLLQVKSSSSVQSPLLAILNVAQDRIERLVYTVPEAGRLLGLSRNAAYAAAKRGDKVTLWPSGSFRGARGPQESSS